MYARTLPLLLIACGDDPTPGVWANGEPFAECRPVEMAACRDEGRSFALAVCGSLEVDNTLDVSGASADIALWVRDAATTRAPLRVDGDYWSQSNTATNTQTISGTTRTNAEAPACSLKVVTRADANSNVRITEPADVDLAGCSFAQPNLEVDNTLDVHIRDDVTWVIEGDLRVAAPLEIFVDPGAHLRWVIGGRLDIDNTLTVAGPTTLSVGGPIRVAAPFNLDGSLIAPQSRVEANNTVTITGAAYVGSLRVAAPTRIEGKPLLQESACTPH